MKNNYIKQLDMIEVKCEKCGKTLGYSAVKLIGCVWCSDCVGAENE